MAYIPFIGRLFLNEYFALLGSMVLIGLEICVRVITLALPERLLRWLYHQSRSIFNFFSSPKSEQSQTHKKKIANPIAQAHDFVDLCELYGYYAEEHVVQTEDGYLLGVHRLAWKPGEEGTHVNAGPGSLQKKVVYLHHGLMMNSEVWVCLTEKERCLPFVLVEQGYDVWLGNNRGNKYSKKSVRYSPTTNDFWNYSIDQFAFHDIPDTIEYILSTTKQESLSYIGFSQGTAQAFATLSIHPTLNEKVDVFIALAPAMSPPGLANGIVASFVKTSPEILYLAFGRKSILSSAGMWQALLYPPIFVRFIDIALKFLFGWHTANISPNQKLAAYPHLYSFSSTKSVVHWFQIIRTGTFQMFDDELQSPLSIMEGSRFYKVARFPTRNIRTPIVLVYGGSDSLVDIQVMMKELPAHTVAQEVPHYEHLDFLWASDVDKMVFPSVFEALDLHAKGIGGKESRYSRQFSIAGPNPFRPARASLANIHHDEVDPSDSFHPRSILKRTDHSLNGSRRTSMTGGMNGLTNGDTNDETHGMHSNEPFPRRTTTHWHSIDMTSISGGVPTIPRRSSVKTLTFGDVPALEISPVGKVYDSASPDPASPNSPPSLVTIVGEIPRTPSPKSIVSSAPIVDGPLQPTPSKIPRLPARPTQIQIGPLEHGRVSRAHTASHNDSHGIIASPTRRAYTEPYVGSHGMMVSAARAAYRVASADVSTTQNAEMMKPLKKLT